MLHADEADHVAEGAADTDGVGKSVEEASDYAQVAEGERTVARVAQIGHEGVREEGVQVDYVVVVDEKDADLLCEVWWKEKCEIKLNRTVNFKEKIIVFVTLSEYRN